MAALNLSVRHGQTLEAAKAHFVKGITEAEARYGSYIKRVDWSDDRTEARLSGPGFQVELRLDHDAVHASGTVPFFARFLESPVRRFIEETLRPPKPS